MSTVTEKLGRAGRFFSTAFSFIFFGIGGILLGTVIFGLLHLMYPKEKARRLCRYGVHLSFRGFIGFMHRTRVLTYDIQNVERLQGSGKFIIANHPSLIDIVFIVAQIPDAYCVVKSSAWKNPYMGNVMRGTGYIPNLSPEYFVAECTKILKAGGTLVMFPEGTRTVPGKAPKFLRGVARISLEADKAFTPVHLAIEPTTLTKGEPWYYIPKKRMFYQLHVENDIDPRTVFKGSKNGEPSVRKLTKYLENYFATMNKRKFGSRNE